MDENVKKMYESFSKAKKEKKESASEENFRVDYVLPDGKVIEK